MTTPALTIGWAFWQRHRRGLTALFACFLFVAGVTALAHTLLDANWASLVCGLSWSLLAMGGCYAAAVFAYGFDVDLAVAGTCFPARAFTLPVRTAALAGWPVLYGAGFLALFWLASAGLVFRPWAYNVPWAWPALLAAATLVWTQALLWWPFGLPWSRVVVGVLLLHVPASTTLVLLRFDAAPGTVLGFLAGATGAGALVAWAGVARSRRGAVPSWDWLLRPGRAVAGLWPRRRGGFRSAAHAQAWFEGRRHGTRLPLIVAGLLPFLLLPLFLEEKNPQSLTRDLGLILLMPVFIAGLGGGSAGRNNPWTRDYYGVAAFVATRPMTTAQLVAAQLRMAAGVTLLTWALVAAALAAALSLSGADKVVREIGRQWLAARPAAEVVAALVAVAALLVLWTWKRWVENLLVGLTGREWVIKGNLFAGVLAAFALVMFGMWFITQPEYHRPVLDALPWLLAAAVALKLLAAAAVVRGLRRRGLIPDRTLAVLAAVWLGVVGTLGGLLAWVVPAEAVAAPTLVLAVAVMSPLARLAAMPLALDGNRHR